MLVILAWGASIVTHIWVLIRFGVHTWCARCTSTLTTCLARSGRLPQGRLQKSMTVNVWRQTEYSRCQSAEIKQIWKKYLPAALMSSLIVHIIQSCSWLPGCCRDFWWTTFHVRHIGKHAGDCWNADWVRTSDTSVSIWIWVERIPESSLLDHCNSNHKVIYLLPICRDCWDWDRHAIVQLL